MRGCAAHWQHIMCSAGHMGHDVASLHQDDMDSCTVQTYISFSSNTRWGSLKYLDRKAIWRGIVLLCSISPSPWAQENTYTLVQYLDMLPSHLVNSTYLLGPKGVGNRCSLAKSTSFLSLLCSMHSGGIAFANHRTFAHLTVCVKFNVFITL